MKDLAHRLFVRARYAMSYSSDPSIKIEDHIEWEAAKGIEERDKRIEELEKQVSELLPNSVDSGT